MRGSILRLVPSMETWFDPSIETNGLGKGCSQRTQTVRYVVNSGLIPNPYGITAKGIGSHAGG